jgi:hypothetical protein
LLERGRRLACSHRFMMNRRADTQT